jgi:hypothetical protein
MSAKRRLARSKDFGQSGPEALRDWVANHYDVIQGFHRALTQAGRPAEVLWLMPRSENIETPPVGANHYSLAGGRAYMRANLPNMSGTLAGPPLPGMFYVVASKGDGRLKGTFVGMVQIPDQEEELPVIGVVFPGKVAIPDDPSNN